MADILNELIILKNPGNSSATARIQKTGRLGFSLDGINMMGINETKFLRLAKRKDEKDKDILFLIIDSEEREGAVPVIKAGHYYYISGAGLFNELGFNFEQEKFSFHIKRTEGSNNIFKLVRYFSKYRKKNGKEKVK